MTARSDRVPGEDVPWPIALGLAVIGCAAAAAAAHATTIGQTSTASASRELAPPHSQSVSPPALPPPPLQLPAAEPLDCAPTFAVSFPERSVRVTADVSARATALASWLAAHPGAVVIVEGHASATGSERENLKLGFKRARSLARALERGGVPARRVTPQSFGQYRPQPGVASVDGINRRAVVRVEPADSRCSPESQEVVEQ